MPCTASTRSPSTSRMASYTATFRNERCSMSWSGSTCTKRSCWKTGISFKRENHPTRSHLWSSEMIPRVGHAKYVGDYTVHLRFADGAEGDVDLAEELYGELFEPLKDLAVFRQFAVHPEFHTLCWPNGADFAPEFLYEKVQLPV